MRQDILWKGLLEWLFDDLLRFVFWDADRVFNLQAPMDFMDKELAQICAGSGGYSLVRYFNLVFAKHQQRYPIASIAIFTGQDGHLLIKNYAYSFMTTRLPFEYSTININALSEEELGTSKNPFAWALFVAKQALLRGPDREERLLEKKWFLFQKLYDNGLLKDRKLQVILSFNR